MIPAEAVISRVRRDLTLGAIVRAALVVGALAVVLWSSLTAGDGAAADVLLFLAIGGVWLALSVRSVKGSRLAADSSSLIAEGKYDAAEKQLEEALSGFSLFRTVKLLSMHHLAVLRHAQRRWPDTAALCRALLGQRLGALKGLSKPSRLILADALLEMGDARGARDALDGLYDQRLTLSEATTLLSLQVDYQARVGAWQAMAHRIETKVQVAELMPAASAARTQALLALAAKKQGRDDWAEWLRRRAELLVDVQELCARRHLLWELWAVEPPASDGPAGPAVGGAGASQARGIAGTLVEDREV